MRSWALTACAVGVWGCAGAPTPTAELEGSAAAIRAAQEVGAGRVPQAALHLQLAREQSDQAKVLIDKGERDRAAYVLLRAEADAELAVALAREDAERTQAQQAVEQVRSLRGSSR